jgi:hypothetical protein
MRPITQLIKEKALRNRALRTAPKNKKDLLPLIRDRECRQLFRSLLPTVPLLADLVEHRSKSDSRASARTAGACASAREPLHPRLRLVPRTVQYRCPRSALGDATLRARCPLPERIPPSTYRVRLDAGQDRCFRHAARFYGLPRGVTHVLRSSLQLISATVRGERLTAGYSSRLANGATEISCRKKFGPRKGRRVGRQISQR